ncbi:hematopoietic cell signal transducer isoform X2 [Suricata suricatta]|uniref:hematopoietic cell signal transducer isoform X2 n=1 Tax=Suricata suricatta TaxID=37032 RepID=UPI0011558C88|nr:hematopoietic cell signal transducer isoform X2 [Suricata suricatta]
MAPSSDILLLLLLPVATALTTPGSCSGCGLPSLSLLAGLVAADAAVSLLIIAVVFVCVGLRHRHRPTRDDKIYINMPARG